MSDMLFNNIGPQFPGMGSVIDVCDMEIHHVPETEYEKGKVIPAKPAEAGTTGPGMDADD